MQYSNEVQNAVTMIEDTISPYWNDENSMVKVIYENGTIFVHLAMKPKNGFFTIPRKKIFFLSQLLGTCMFKEDFQFVNGTFTLTWAKKIKDTVESISTLRTEAVVLRNYYS